jgi:hypothetical protein
MFAGAPLIYAKYFSAQELRDMAAFYQTETGSKALRMMPQVMSEYFGTLMPRMEEFNRDLQTRLQAILAKHGVKYPAADHGSGRSPPGTGASKPFSMIATIV